MLELYNILSNIIDPICKSYNSHYPTLQDGDTVKSYPHVIINFPTSTANNEFSDNNLLELSIWDDKDTDINEIETITDAIHEALNKTRYLTPTIFAYITKEVPYRIVLNDEMIGIQRRKLRYKVRLYKIQGVI